MVGINWGMAAQSAVSGYNAGVDRQRAMAKQDEDKKRRGIRDQQEQTQFDQGQADRQEFALPTKRAQKQVLQDSADAAQNSQLLLRAHAAATMGDIQPYQDLVNKQLGPGHETELRQNPDGSYDMMHNGGATGHAENLDQMTFGGKGSVGFYQLMNQKQAGAEVMADHRAQQQTERMMMVERQRGKNQMAVEEERNRGRAAARGVPGYGSAGVARGRQTDMGRSEDIYFDAMKADQRFEGMQEQQMRVLAHEKALVRSVRDPRERNMATKQAALKLAGAAGGGNQEEMISAAEQLHGWLNEEPGDTGSRAGINPAFNGASAAGGAGPASSRAPADGGAGPPQAGPGPQARAKYPDGTQVTDRDGKLYIVRGGVPVPAGQ